MKRTTPALVSQEDMSQQRAYASEVAARKQRPQTYCVITYGCQMNAHDSEQLAGMLREMGMCEAENKEDADLVLYNTCCVRENAERRALGNVMWLKQRKEQKPDLIIGVCGCMMQQPHMAERLLRQYRFVDIAFGTHNLYRFPEYMLRVLETRRQVVEILPDEDVRIAEEMPIERVNPYNAYVNIMFGCNNFCSYCIVPYVRGRERSRAADDILREVEGLLQAGVQEIMLLGQNVNSYGNDLEGTLSFPQLLRRLDAMGVPRIRFMTSHPKDATPKLLKTMA
ncbi:MAG: radical SAM protein, partial [Clostridia bacterium]